MPKTNDLICMSAREIRSLLAKKSVSPQELLTAANNRINEVDSHVNALPTLCFERAYSLAKKLDYSETPLKGIPIAIKDLMAVSGVRTTWGSRVYENHVPTKSDLLIDRIESNGAIIYAKSNTPEFGAGANTFNDIFGTTLNPWNTSLSAAGSSGGSAVALATGMAWLATGSDLGGSLRNPASFCGVVGLRPTIGRIPADPGPLAFDRMSVDGPMARNIGDVAMLFDNMVGRHDRDPMSHFDVPKDFELAVDAKVKPKRIAFSRDFGVTPVDKKIANICKFAAEKFCEIGVPVEEAHPDFSGLQHVFQTLRAISFAANLGPLLNKYRKILKPEIVWNIEKGLKLTSEEIVSAMAERSRIYAGAVDFFNKYDLLLSPATIVAPYPASTRYVESVGEHTFSNYIEWCSIAYAITIIGAPALSIPCGFTDTKLPVGLQMVGKPGGEAALLGAAALLEESLEILPSAPIDPK